MKQEVKNKITFVTTFIAKCFKGLFLMVEAANIILCGTYWIVPAFYYLFGSPEQSFFHLRVWLACIIIFANLVVWGLIIKQIKQGFKQVRSK